MTLTRISAQGAKDQRLCGRTQTTDPPTHDLPTDRHRHHCCFHTAWRIFRLMFSQVFADDWQIMLPDLHLICGFDWLRAKLFGNVTFHPAWRRAGQDVHTINDWLMRCHTWIFINPRFNKHSDTEFKSSSVMTFLFFFFSKEMFSWFCRRVFEVKSCLHFPQNLYFYDKCSFMLNYPKNVVFVQDLKHSEFVYFYIFI